MPTSSSLESRVADFQEARGWYERFFGRAPDVVAHDEEVMWQVTGAGWLYIRRDAERAGDSIVAIAVSDIEVTVSVLEARGVSAGPIKPEGDAGRKAVVLDPVGNRLEIIEVAAATLTPEHRLTDPRYIAGGHTASRRSERPGIGGIRKRRRTTRRHASSNAGSTAFATG